MGQHFGFRRIKGTMALLLVGVLILFAMVPRPPAPAQKLVRRGRLSRLVRFLIRWFSWN